MSQQQPPADPFRTAIREALKARIALVGPSKTGKTLAALGIARGLVGPEGRIAVVDTENESSRLYADLLDFGIVGMSGNYAPARYAGLVGAVPGWGYDCLILDSVSPAWSGPGGVLEIVDNAKRRSNSSGWDVGTPEHQKLIQAILHSPIHVIATIRAKQKWEYQKDSDGKLQITKLGLGPEQRDQFDYEFTITGTFAADHVLALDARGDLAGETLPVVDGHATAFKMYVDLGERVGKWLGAGAPRAAVAPPPPVATPTPPVAPEAPTAPPAQPDAQPAPAAADPTIPASSTPSSPPSGGTSDSTGTAAGTDVPGSAEAAAIAAGAGLDVPPPPAPEPPKDPSEPGWAGAAAAEGAALNGAMTDEQTMEITVKLAECANMRPDAGPWEDRLNNKARDMFGKTDWRTATVAEAQRLIETLETTRLALREQATAAAAGGA